MVGLLFVFTYLYLFSAWQTIISQPWAQLLFAMGLAQIILLISAPGREQRFAWSELALTLGLFLYPRMIQEMRALFTNATVYRAGTAAGFIVILVSFLFYILPMGKNYASL